MSKKKQKQQKAKYKIERLDAHRYIVPKQGAMRTEGMVYASDTLFEDIREDPCVDQVANVAHLPGIVGRAMAMPDMHWGYGFPIGGVAAFDADEGVVSPGGVGYDINCGVRLLRTDIPGEALAERAELGALLDALYKAIPSGVGSRRDDIELSDKEIERVLIGGAAWAVERGWGEDADVSVIEAGGVLPGAELTHISPRARARGKRQLGTLGSGNHFCEVGVIDEIYDAEAATAYGLVEGAVTVLIHTGSRGLGYQVCDDHLKLMVRAAAKHGITLPDRQLCCAPVKSDEGQAYLGAMAAAANFAFANRQLITDRVRRAISELTPQHTVEVVYDVCHNIAKIETHHFEGTQRQLCVHRKGATRAFGPGHSELPALYREVGQPVLVPGDMGRYSYVLAGAAGASETFGSCCHGAGRRLSRSKALKAAKKRDLFEELNTQGVLIRAASRRTVAEEMPEAYKDVANVVDAVQGAGIANKVAKLRPLGVVKG